MKQDRTEKYLSLRNEFPEFIFESFNADIKDESLELEFLFRLPSFAEFRSTMRIAKQTGIPFRQLEPSILHNLAFHIGMIELISYWKTSCAPRLIIKPFQLEPEAVQWWKKLYYHGLGEFFHMNSIDADPTEFVNLVCTGSSPIQSFTLPTERAALIPVGGGKDSVVTLEMLKQHFPRVHPLIVNPRGASTHTALNAGFRDSDVLVIHRHLDPRLLKMNEQGFLNGHTPFSALLAFTGLLAAAISNCDRVILSNESSANEPTVSGTQINHQYSKSFEFEQDLRRYQQQYICSDIQYFSFLRPLSELQIASLFAGFKHHHADFRSCNAGSKTNSWCGKCAKCLFTYIILSPFLNSEDLVKIIGSDLYEDGSLKKLLDELTGNSTAKPFECIGTLEEVNVALVAALEKHPDEPLPALLQHYRSSTSYDRFKHSKVQDLLLKFDQHHFLSPELFNLLKNTLYA